MKKINALIIDDEIAAAENISILLDTFCPEINVVEITHSISKGFQSIKKNNPDLIFLDISMPPEGTGFDLLDMLPNRNFHVIFVTAHDQYALKAIKQRAFDYLLKPIDSDDLEETIAKIKKYSSRSLDSNKIEKVLLRFNEKLNTKKIDYLIFK